MNVTKLPFQVNYSNFDSEKLKWLEQFYRLYSVHYSFLNQLDFNLKMQFELSIDKKINWMHKLFFFEPIEAGQISLIQHDNLIYYKISCAIVDKYTDNHFFGQLFWYDSLYHLPIDLEKEVSTTISFYWILDIENDGIKIATLKNYNELYERKYLDFNLQFPSYTYLTELPFEFMLVVSMDCIDEVNNIREELEILWGVWNNNSDQALILKLDKLNQGFIHNIELEKIKDKDAYFYVDAGSAHEGIHEFLLKGLSDSGIKIKHVEILGL